MATPFVPNMDDCKLTVRGKGYTCYIMDTVCRNMTAEDKARADAAIINVHVGHALRQAQKGVAG